MLKTIAIGFLVSGMLVAGRPAAAKTTPEQKCAAAKQKAAGKEIAAELGCYAKATGKALPTVDQLCLDKATGKMSAAFTKAGTACVGDLTGVQSQVDGCVNQLMATATAPVNPGDPPATGKCPADKIKASGKKSAAKLGCTAKSAGSGKPLDPLCIMKAETKFDAAITKADSKGTCVGTQVGLEVVVDNVCFNPIASSLPPVAPACGNGIIEPGETCDDGNTVNGDSCPSDCVIQSCTPGATTRTFTVSFSGSTNVAGIQVLLDYPEGKVSIPGSGGDSFVTGSISNTPAGALLVSNDLDYALIQSVTTAAALPVGPIFRVTFQDCQGATAPTPADFTCTVTDASDPTGFIDLTGVTTCSVSAP